MNTENANVYYMSTDENPFVTFISPVKLEKVAYPIIETAPDASLKNPKYDWTKMEWFDNATESNAQKLATLESKVEQVTKNVEASGEQNSLVMKQVQSSQKMMMDMQTMIAGIAKSVGATPAPTNETTTENHAE